MSQKSDSLFLFISFRCRTATEYFTCRLRLGSTACLPVAATVKYKVACAATVFIFRATLYQISGSALPGMSHARSLSWSKSSRIILVNHKLRKYKEQARQRLLSEHGITHRKKRPADVEVVFAAIKHNNNFRRFNLRGLPKVEVETGLLAIAHNLAKMVN